MKPWHSKAHIQQHLMKMLLRHNHRRGTKATLRKNIDVIIDGNHPQEFLW